MRSHRSASSETSDEDYGTPPSRRDGKRVKRRTVPFLGEDHEDTETEDFKLIELMKKMKEKKRKDTEEKEPASEASESEEDENDDLARSIGGVLRVSGTGKEKRNHYNSFEYDGLQYHLDDPVLLVPETKHQKPRVAIVKDIFQTCDGAIKVTIQRLYRPEEAEKEVGGYWPSRNMREVFYSFHRTEVPAESVMHKCALHFIPLDKQILPRRQLPGFVFQFVYDAEKQMLFKLRNQNYDIYSKYMVRD